MVDLTEVALRFLRLYGPLALLLFTFLETSMLFPFLPSEVVVPAAAAVLIDDPFSFVVFVTAASVGGTVGAFVPFYVFRDSRVGGAHWIRKHVHVSDSHVERAQDWFRRWGNWSVLWGRFLPAIRSLVSIPAGMAKMRATQFGAYTAIGSVGFYAAVGALVYYGRERSLFEAAYDFAMDRPGIAAVGVLVLVVVVLVAKWVARTAASD